MSSRDVVAERKRSTRGRDTDRIVTAFAKNLICEAERTEGGQKALADRAGLSASNLSQVKNGRMGIGWGTAFRLARARGQHLWEFVRDAYEWAEGGDSVARRAARRRTA